MVNHKVKIRISLPTVHPGLFSGISISLLPSCGSHHVLHCPRSTSEEGSLSLEPLGRKTALGGESSPEVLSGPFEQSEWTDLVSKLENNTWSASCASWLTPTVVILYLCFPWESANRRETKLFLWAKQASDFVRETHICISLPPRRVTNERQLAAPADSAASPTKHISKHILLGKQNQHPHRN